MTRVHETQLDGRAEAGLSDASREESHQASLRAPGRRGQNTVEYLMMLAVIVGVILVVGRMFKPQISGIMNDVMAKIRSATDAVSRPD